MSQNAQNVYLFLGSLIGLALIVLAFLWFYVRRSMKKIELSEDGRSPGESKTSGAGRHG